MCVSWKISEFWYLHIFNYVVTEAVFKSSNKFFFQKFLISCMYYTTFATFNISTYIIGFNCFINVSNKKFYWTFRNAIQYHYICRKQTCCFEHGKYHTIWLIVYGIFPYKCNVEKFTENWHSIPFPERYWISNRNLIDFLRQQGNISVVQFCAVYKCNLRTKHKSNMYLQILKWFWVVEVKKSIFC